MAIDQFTAERVRDSSAEIPAERLPPEEQPSGPPWEGLRRVLQPLASLKLTVVLMLMAIVIVLAGTFAQVNRDIWQAIHEYFRVNFSRAFTATFPFVHLEELFVRIDVDLFFPPSFFPREPTFPQGLGWLAAFWPKGPPDFPDWAAFWFPRGWTIGIVMFLNLLAAHLLRFKMQARGSALWNGLGVLLLGLLVTWGVIASGSNTDGPQGQPLISYGTLWKLMQFSLFALAAPAIYGSLSLAREANPWRKPLAAAAVLLCGLGVGSFWIEPFSSSSMRIVYQLLKGLAAAGVLLAGCLLLFRKRAGIVLLHGGIGLLMGYEVLVGVAHVESRMVIFEGEETNYSYDLRTTELAFVAAEGSGSERHVVVRGDALREQKRLSDPRLPFDVELIDWFENAGFAPLEAGETPVATAGLAARARQKLVALKPASGTDGGEVNVPGANVRLIDRQSGQEVGVYSLWARFERGQPAAAGGKDYDVFLRFERHYKPYSVYLYEIQQNNYSGTTRARDYRAIIRLTRQDGTVELDHYPIWMNNPLRYAGETYYQSEIKTARDGDRMLRATEFQVVKNQGWMAPYVACVIVAVGMLFQFGLSLQRFLGRTARLGETAGEVSFSPLIHWGVPAASAALGLSCVAVFALQPPKVVEGFRVGEFGQLPVVAGGRAMPIDTLARNRLMLISDRQSFKPRDANPQDDTEPRSLPAIYWLLEMAARPEQADDLPVFRIENDELTRSLGMEVSASRTYSLNDFVKARERLLELARAAHNVPREQQTVLQRKQIDLFMRLQNYDEVKDWFFNPWEQVTKINPDLLDPEAPGALRMRAAEALAELLQALRNDPARAQMPLMIPTHLQAPERSLAGAQGTTWEPFQVAAGHYGLEKLVRAEHSPATEKFLQMLQAWRDQDASAFNAALDEYKTFLAQAPAAELAKGLVNVSFKPVRFEEYFNRFSPFNALSWIYLGVVLAPLTAWLLAGMGRSDWSVVANRSGLWLAAALLLVHTWAIAARIYISGKPPVTNLYSSAVFIGWAAVLTGMLFERLFPRGFGNVVASAAGFMTLRIAYGLMSDGDTLGVLEPVLDTNFWLATHVVCITLGYAATYVTGLLGLLYILRGSRLGLLAVALLLAPAGGLLVARGETASVMGGAACLLGAAAAAVLGGLTLNGTLDATFSDSLRKTFARMIYGTLCAATLLSFVGTVLGGLWADDSWGRFWGWDPKENGALIIVLWNALILHARWDGLVRERGLAALAVLGNLVVTWSWFGTNMLGVGLHSYGFTEGRLFWLLAFGLSQVVLAAIAALPKSCWWQEARTPAVG